MPAGAARAKRMHRGNQAGLQHTMQCIDEPGRTGQPHTQNDAASCNQTSTRPTIFGLSRPQAAPALQDPKNIRAQRPQASSCECATAPKSLACVHRHSRQNTRQLVAGTLLPQPFESDSQPAPPVTGAGRRQIGRRIDRSTQRCFNDNATGKLLARSNESGLFFRPADRRAVAHTFTRLASTHYLGSARPRRMMSGAPASRTSNCAPS
jgi:hypothetical protein